MSAPLVAGSDKHPFPLLPLLNKGNGVVDERMATKGMPCSDEVEPRPVI